MTKVFYRCITSDGQEKVVLTLSEAKKIQEEGGTYEVAFDYEPSDAVGFAKDITRIVPKKRR